MHSWYININGCQGCTPMLLPRTATTYGRSLSLAHNSPLWMYVLLWGRVSGQSSHRTLRGTESTSCSCALPRKAGNVRNHSRDVANHWTNKKNSAFKKIASWMDDRPHDLIVSLKSILNFLGEVRHVSIMNEHSPSGMNNGFLSFLLRKNVNIFGAIPVPVCHQSNLDNLRQEYQNFSSVLLPLVKIRLPIMHEPHVRST